MARQPLTAAQWGQVPAPSAAVVGALPAVLARSREEARLLVQQHLDTGQRQRLRTLALCLARAQRRADVQLPLELTGRLLASAGSLLAP